MFNNVNFALASNSNALARLQEQAATGQRIVRVSDDPFASYHILNLDSQNRSFTNYSSNIANVVDMLDVSSSTILNIQQNINNARTTITQIGTGTFSDEGGYRSIASQSIDDILEQIVSLANSKYLNQYMFGGTNTATAPYTVERADNGEISSVSYQGAESSRVVEVAPNVRARTMAVGSDIFQSSNYGQPIFYGTTGVKTGTGSSNVTGDSWLKVDNDGTNYKLSIDDGATWTVVPLGGEENTMVTDSRTGKILYVDTRTITSTGTEPVRMPGTYDVFNTLITIRDLLRNTNDLPAQKLEEMRTLMVSSLEEVNLELSRSLTTVGGQINTLSDLKLTLDDLGSKAQEQSDIISQADIAQISVELSRHELLYQMSMQVASKLLSLNFLDFIR
ncbi:MAG: flagellar hook-associated protein 3 [Planctomycetes bacterium GWC2_49_10]|nr:MAG: flagellar hook-associated protein 3 [Planctomycetes bacterium GWC2_49_10]